MSTKNLYQDFADFTSKLRKFIYDNNFNTSEILIIRKECSFSTTYSVFIYFCVIFNEFVLKTFNTRLYI